MSNHENYTRLKRQIALCLVTGVALFSAAPMTYAATSVVGNNTLPQNGQFIAGSGTISSPANNSLQLNVHQKQQNAVIKWGSFDIGGNASVNFTADVNNFNTLNYVNNGNASQIYGTINAAGGNIYIVNPAGVQIGNSAQINVGSLYVSNKNLDTVINRVQGDANPDISNLMSLGVRTDAELMSLGNINADTVIFEGDGRIVIDTERIKDVAGDNKLSDDKINIRTADNNLDNLVIGYDGYDETNGYRGANTSDDIATVNETKWTKADGYMWSKM